MSLINKSKMAITYIHKSLDSDEIFYVGIGKSHDRSTSLNKRSKAWHYYVNKHGFKAEIIYDNISWEEAGLKEIELISLYGRRDLGKGTLVNMTNGGQGGDTLSGKKNPGLSRRNSEMRGKPGVKLKWINKDGKNSRVTEEKIEQRLTEGWNLGATKRGKRPGHIVTVPWNKGLSGYKNPKLSVALKGKKFKPRVTCECPHCGKIGDTSNMIRWHFDNCKQK